MQHRHSHRFQINWSTKAVESKSGWHWRLVRQCSRRCPHYGGRPASVPTVQQTHFYSLKRQQPIDSRLRSDRLSRSAALLFTSPLAATSRSFRRPSGSTSTCVKEVAMTRDIRRAIIFCGCVAILGSGLLFGNDWPQWRGPNRDAKATGFTARRSGQKAHEEMVRHRRQRRRHSRARRRSALRLRSPRRRRSHRLPRCQHGQRAVVRQVRS